MLQQRSHVPKFGNWDGDNVPYTVYFENARKEKGGGVRMNPNDPEENPELFMFGVGGASFSHPVQPPLQVNSEKSTSTESSQVEGHKPSHHRKVSNHHKNGSGKSMTSQSGSEKSNSDNSIHQARHRRTRSDRKKSTNEGSNSNIFCPPSPGPNRFRSGTNPLEDTVSEFFSITITARNDLFIKTRDQIRPFVLTAHDFSYQNTLPNSIIYLHI